MLDEAERSLHDALCVLSQTVQDSRVIYGGGWAEMQARSGWCSGFSSMGTREGPCRVADKDAARETRSLFHCVTMLIDLCYDVD